MLLYQNMVLSEQGKIKESLQHLEKFENLITDKLKVNEIKGKIKLTLYKQYFFFKTDFVFF